MTVPAQTAPEPLHGMKLVLASVAVASASFMNLLDTTIATVAVPAISGSLAATPSQGTWIITSYGVCLAVTLPLSGWITRRFGEVRVFSIALLVFTLTSVLCGMAPSFGLLIVFRALQGFSGGLLLALSQALLLKIYPRELHGFAMTIWGLVSAVAPILGPILGGYLTDTAGWPWIFYVNAPIGIIACLISWSLLMPYESVRHRDPVDLVGLLLMMGFVICLQLGLDRGQELDWFESTQIRLLFGTSFLSLVFFLAWERFEAHPVIDFSVFRHRSFLLGSLLFSLHYISILMPTVIYPIWLQTSMGFTATWAGLVMAPTMIPPLIVFPFLRGIMARIGIRATVVFGCAAYGYAMFLTSENTTDLSAAYIALVRTSLGVGMPFVFMSLLSSAMAPLPPEKYATGSGIYNFMRMVAGTLGTAAAVSLWDRRTVLHRSRLLETIDPDAGVTQAMFNTPGLSTPVDHGTALAALEQLIHRQAQTLALNDVMYASTISVFAVGVLAALLLPAHTRAPVHVSAAMD